jgi:diacylglycerol kinase (ATP)
MPQRYIVVANPATHGDARRLVEAVRRFAPSFVTLDVHYTDPNIKLGEVVDFDGKDVAAVVAIGGDGTVRAVATAVGERHIPIGIVPGGSTNIIAQELGIPTKPERAIGLIFGNHSLYTMDAGACGEDRFLHIAGAGLDSRFFAATDQSQKRRIGWRAYLRPFLKQLAEPPVRFSIVADDAVVHVVSPLVLVANGTSILKPFLPIYPDVRSNDGWLDVLIFTPIHMKAIARTVASFALKRLNRSPYVTRIRANHVELTTNPVIPVQLDGDVYGETPLMIDIRPGALSIIVPPKSLNKL